MHVLPSLQLYSLLGWLYAVSQPRQIARDLELGSGFRFTPLHTTSHELATIWHKCDEKAKLQS